MSLWGHQRLSCSVSSERLQDELVASWKLRKVKKKLIIKISKYEKEGTCLGVISDSDDMRNVIADIDWDGFDFLSTGKCSANKILSNQRFYVSRAKFCEPMHDPYSGLQIRIITSPKYYSQYQRLYPTWNSFVRSTGQGGDLVTRQMSPIERGRWVRYLPK